jgi:hypothetical protein
MPFPTSVNNKLLDNVFKGIEWDTTGAAASFGNMNARASTSSIAADGTGFVGVSNPATANFNGGTVFPSATGSSSIASNIGTLVPSSGAGRGTVVAIAVFEGTGTGALRAYYNLPVARTHYSGDSLVIGANKLSFSLA